MSIVYERTFEVEYDNCKITDEQKNVLAEKLQANDVIAHGWYNDNFKNITYGEQEHVEFSTSYQIVDEDNNIIFQNEFTSITNDVFNQISQHIGGLSLQEEYNEVKSIKMKEIDGERLCFDDGLINAEYVNAYAHNYIYLDEDVRMMVRFSGSHYSNIKLKFVISWESDRVKRADVIENKLVVLPLADMGIMQKLFEDSLNDMGYWTEDATVHCFFETKTETKSECSPDIVRLVRDARNKGEEE